MFSRHSRRGSSRALVADPALGVPGYVQALGAEDDQGVVAMRLPYQVIVVSDLAEDVGKYLGEGAILFDPISGGVGAVIFVEVVGDAKPCAALILAIAAPFVGGPQLGFGLSGDGKFQLLFPGHKLAVLEAGGLGVEVDDGGAKIDGVLGDFVGQHVEMRVGLLGEGVSAA